MLAKNKLNATKIAIALAVNLIEISFQLNYGVS